MDLKIEVIPIPVSDVDAAMAFYTEKVGFNLDHDMRPNDSMRVAQMTPPGSSCSVVIGKGLPLGDPGSVKGSSSQSRRSTSLAPLAPGAIGCVGVKPNGDRVLLRAVPDPLAE